MAEREPVLDPTGDDERTVNLTLAPRPRGLRGRTAGLLDNGKPNAALLLTEVARQLRQRHDIRTWVTYTKGYFGTPVEQSQIQQILENCDFAVAGLGD
ncbi:MAG TPA: hypothetical protein VGX25_11970 [Actinophytocola sp.]|nr:hypothetical protein [Actinophytocola sp.]HEV2780101.1 hypothetical protein [Actinophytocola sp.]